MAAPETRTRACPVCCSFQTRLFAHARDVEYYTSDQTFTYLSCDTCGSVHLDRPPFDQLSRIYPPNYYSYQSPQRSTSLIERIKQRVDTRVFRRLLRHVEGDHLRVLDVGGGSGWLLSLLRTVSPRIKETHEVDINEDARSAAESAGHVFHCCPVETFSSTQRFDLILLLNLIEHVVDPASVLCSLRKLLSPTGLILIKTPNIDTLDGRLFRNHNWGGFHCPRHFVLFNKDSLEHLGTRCGFQVREAFYTQGGPQWACSILGWLGLKGWLRISADRPLYTHPVYPAVSALAAAFDFARSPFMATAQMFAVFQLTNCKGGETARGAESRTQSVDGP